MFINVINGPYIEVPIDRELQLTSINNPVNGIAVVARGEERPWIWLEEECIK